jgi:transposase-like protein
MVHFLSSASRAAVVALQCPRCGLAQARARKKSDEKYTCKRCGHDFTLEEGTPPEKR